MMGMKVLGFTKFPYDLPSIQETCPEIRLVYVLDPYEIRKLVEDLASRGWLGPGMLESMEHTLRTELERLAENILEDIALRLGCPDAERRIVVGSPDEVERIYPGIQWITE